MMNLLDALLCYLHLQSLLGFKGSWRQVLLACMHSPCLADRMGTLQDICVSVVVTDGYCKDYSHLIILVIRCIRPEWWRCKPSLLLFMEMVTLVKMTALIVDLVWCYPALANSLLLQTCLESISTPVPCALCIAVLRDSRETRDDFLMMDSLETRGLLSIHWIFLTLGFINSQGWRIPVTTACLLEIIWLTAGLISTIYTAKLLMELARYWSVSS